jgi:uncharacterized protein
MIEQIYKRKILQDIEKYLDSKEAIVVYGARQVGKTTLLKYLIENNLKEMKNNVFYFDLELMNLLELCNQGPEIVFNYLIEKGADEKKQIYLIIDEIQYLENPTNFIKIMHDHYLKIKLLVSGSSTFEIKKKFKNSLVGRIICFEMYPLCFEEFLIFKNKRYNLTLDNSETTNNELIFLAKEYMKYGGYPKIVLENSEEKKQILLFQIINTYINKDIRDIGNIRNISGFNKLVQVLASQSGQLLNVSELSNTLKMNRETIEEYLDLLENTFIIKRIKPFHKNLRSELSKNPKVFFLDTGMMHLLWLKEFPKIIFGNVFETFVFLELMKTGNNINFWRTTNKQEIDFILNSNLLYAIEVKLNFQKANLKTFNYFTEQYSNKNVIVGLEGKKNGKYVWELIAELKLVKKNE